MNRRETIEVAYDAAVKQIGKDTFDAGPSDSAIRELMKIISKKVPGVTAGEVSAAARRKAEELERWAVILSIIEEIGKRHHSRPDETLADLITRALEAGDPQAVALMKMDPNRRP